MINFEKLDWSQIERHYAQRVNTHRRLIDLHKDGLVEKFAELALGEGDPSGNYSATEHALGPKILNDPYNSKAALRVFNLATEFLSATSAHQVPPIIKKCGLKNLGISVGSEISCMLHPSLCWIANTKSIWAHLAIKHDSVGDANSELQLYKAHDGGSQMAYPSWAAIHAEMGESMFRISEFRPKNTIDIRDFSPAYRHLWADAIASNAYGIYHA